MPQKMRRNATRNISAPTGKTAATKMPSPSASAHSPTQCHGPPPGGGPGGRGPKPGYMLSPSFFGVCLLHCIQKPRFGACFAMAKRQSFHGML